MVEAGSSPFTLKGASTDFAAQAPGSPVKPAMRARFEDPLARRPSETLAAGGGSFSLSSPTSSGKLSKLLPQQHSLLGSTCSMNSPSASSSGMPSPRGEPPRQGANGTDSQSPSTSLFARLLRKKSEKHAAESAGSWMDDDLDLPTRRHQSFSHGMRQDSSVRRSGPLPASGAQGLGAEGGGLQSQTREALQQLLRHKSQCGGDELGQLRSKNKSFSMASSPRIGQLRQLGRCDSGSDILIGTGINDDADEDL